MAVHVDPALPIHPLTADDVAAMVDAGILREHDRVELLDGVLVEMSPQGIGHARAISRGPGAQGGEHEPREHPGHPGAPILPW